MEETEGAEEMQEGVASNENGSCEEGPPERFRYEMVVVCAVPRERITCGKSRKGDGNGGDGDGDDEDEDEDVVHVDVDVVSYLMEALEAAGLEVQHLEGMDSKVFLKVAATEKIIGRAAEKLQLKKQTDLGLQTVFDWDLRDSFTRQSCDGVLFSWTERYYCLDFIIHNLKQGATPQDVHLRMPVASGETACVPLTSGAPLITSLEDAGLVVDIFPLHDEKIRKELLHSWSLNWLGGTSQPLDAVYSYYGPKIALYFAFLGMYTNWLVLPAVTGTLLFLVDFGEWRWVVPPLAAVTMVGWAALFLQFWKRRNFSLLERWELRLEEDEMHARKPWDNTEDESLIEQHSQVPRGLSGQGVGIGPSAQQALDEEEWRDRLVIVRNIIIVFIAVVFFQIPFELLYATFSQQITSGMAKFVSIAGYLYCITKYKGMGCKLAVRLNNAQAHVSSEAAADSLIYKVFWIHFVQSYIGVFYHAFVLQDFKLLRQTLNDRMLMAQIINNVMESLVPYISYLFASRRTFTIPGEVGAEVQASILGTLGKITAIGLTLTHQGCQPVWILSICKQTRGSERREKEAVGEKVPNLSTSRVEKEYLKPRYTTAIADQEVEGLFDDYLELALQFGIVVMFASTFPLVAVLALLNNLVEIRSDSFKLLEMMKRPVPHMVGSIGAWMNIFQYLSGAAIVSNCTLLMFMYDKGGKWSMDPGLAGVLVLEHALLAARFGLSWLVPEVPAWVKAKRRKRRRMQEDYSLHVLRTISNKILPTRLSR